MQRHSTLVVLTFAAAAGCTDPSALANESDPWAFGSAGPALNVVPALPAVCGIPTIVTLIADEVVPAGSVEVTNDESNLYVIYRTSVVWPITKTAVFVGDSPDDIPTSGGGNPRVGKFDYKATHSGVTEVVWEIPLSEVSTTTAVVAAFAELDEAEGAWAEGPMISPGGSWATYFTHEIIACAAETIGSSGGTITTPDGGVTLTIPGGVLTSDVDITIEPATAQEILDHIAQQGGVTDARLLSAPSGDADGSIEASAASIEAASASALLPAIQGVIPVEGTLWKFSPDGLEFRDPITIVIKYDDTKIPAGYRELDMGVFVTNGIFEGLHTTVDDFFNTATAEMAHFSYGFAGFVEQLEADLTIRRLIESADPIELGQAITYTAQLGNFGPDDITDGVVYYSGFGDISAGPLSPGCTEVVAPLVARVEIICDVGSVPSGSSVDAPPVTFVPNRTGTGFVVWADPGSAESDDPDNANNRATASYSVVAPEADLRIQTMFDNPDPANVGTPIKYSVIVIADAAQTVTGATLSFNFNDATFVPLLSDPACIALVQEVTCPLPDLPDGVFHQVDVTLRPDQGIAEFTVVAHIDEPLGTVDPDPTNNSAFESTTIGSSGTADLSITSLIESADPIELGQSVTYQATIQNFGPDGVTDAVVTYTMFGNVEVGPLQPACAEAAVPVGTGKAVRCDVGGLSAPSVSLVAAANFVPQEPGEFTVWVDPGSSATDNNQSNNRFETTLTVTGPEADLSIQNIIDVADPVGAGEPVTYEIQVVANTAQDVVGASLYLRYSDASFVSATDPSCFGTVLGTTCPLPTLSDGLIHGVQITVLPDLGQTLFNVIAEVEVPFGTTDPDQNNDLAFESTAIETGGPAAITVGQIVEGMLPPGGSSDFYRFDGVAGQEIRLHLSVVTGSTGTAQLRLFAPAGGEIYPAGVGGRASDASSANTVETLPFTGEYLIEVGSSGSGPYRLGIGMAAGQLDLGYGPNRTGVVTGPRSSSPRNPFRQMAVLGNDVLTVGEEHLFKFDANGDPVAGFGTNGAVDLGGASGTWGAALRVQPDGKIVVAGYTSPAPSPWWIARFDANGVLDPTFGTNGKVEVQFANDFRSTPVGIRFQQNGPDLDIVVAGHSGDPAGRLAIARLNPDGTLDTGFGSGGTMTDNIFLNTPTYMDVQSDGRILIGATKEVARYTVDGARDATFGVGGLLTYGISGQARGLLVLPNDGLLIMGDESNDAFVMRLTSGGALDGSFGTNGRQLYDFGLPDRFQAATVDGSGNYIVVGHQRTVGGDYEWLVTRMSSSGVLDPSFGIGGYTLENRADDARAVAIDAAGRIIVGGQRNVTIYGVEIARHIAN